MDTFNFPYHTLGVKYPESSAKLTFGRGWEFASKPQGPDQLNYMLNFDFMMFFELAPNLYDEDINPEVNMRKLELFYQKHRLYEKFYYPHPVEGNIIVRFQKPLEYVIKKGGLGSVEPFSITLTTQP